jgi:hypothetical protein
MKILKRAINHFDPLPENYLGNVYGEVNFDKIKTLK